MNKIKNLNEFDIVLSIYNQDKIIEKVLYGIFLNTTTPFNLILVFDGCTDKTEKKALSYIRKYKPKLLKKISINYAPNVYETRANNIGFKLARNDFMITLQDDMVINEYGWERRLTYPLRKFDDVLATTARAAQDVGLMENLENQKYFINQKSRELNTLPRNIFAVRDVINRGPVAFNMNHLKEMGYLNEDYAPSDLDDADLSLRAWKEKKWRVGAFWIDYVSRLEWGKTRAKDSTMYLDKHIPKNAIRLKNDHLDYIKSQIKHDEDIVIEENEIDYRRSSLYKYKVLFYFLIYPIKTRDIKDLIKKIIY